MTMITPSYLGETIEYSSLHACRSTLEDPTGRRHSTHGISADRRSPTPGCSSRNGAAIAGSAIAVGRERSTRARSGLLQSLQELGQDLNKGAVIRSRIRQNAGAAPRILANAATLNSWLDGGQFQHQFKIGKGGVFDSHDYSSATHG